MEGDQTEGGRNAEIRHTNDYDLLNEKRFLIPILLLPEQVLGTQVLRLTTTSRRNIIAHRYRHQVG